MNHATLAIVTASAAAFVAWRVVVRVRRLVGRQPLRLWQHRGTVLVLPTLVGLMFVGALGESRPLLALASGMAAGAALALVGFRRTRFEVTAEGRTFYTPCRPIGIGLALLLIGRIAYRALAWFTAGDARGASTGLVELTPSTLFVFATLAIYYSAFSLGLLVRRARIHRSPWTAPHRRPGESGSVDIAATRGPGRNRSRG